MQRTHVGGCHCGDVRFEVDCDLESAKVVDCNCSICQKKGFLHLIVTADCFRAKHTPDKLATYTFNTGVAQHWFCKRCGVHAYYRPRSHPEGIDVNARCIDGVDLASLRIEPFDGLDWEANVSKLSR